MHWAKEWQYLWLDFWIDWRRIGLGITYRRGQFTFFVGPFTMDLQVIW